MNTEDEKNIFGHNLQILINQRNWSIKQAAEEIGYDRNDLSKILVGSKNFTLETAIKFSRFFNISLFLLFCRLFNSEKYRTSFPFVDTQYMCVIRKNFQLLSAKQAAIDMDSSTVSHIMHGRRKNPTINTLYKIADGASVSLDELLKTEQDKQKEISLEEGEE